MNDSKVYENSETQKSQRRELRSPLIVEKIPCEDTKKTFFGYAKNISSGGLFIATVKPRDPGERFTIELTLPTPDKLTIRCSCEVVWKRHYERNSNFEPGMGLRFFDLSMGQVQKIDHWIKQHSVNAANNLSNN